MLDVLHDFLHLFAQQNGFLQLHEFKWQQK